MVKEETWSVSLDRANAFFLAQEDVIPKGDGCFLFGTCHIFLTALPPKGRGIWSSRRTHVRMEGEENDLSTIYRRFLIQFLTAGG